MPINISIVEDNDRVRESLQILINGTPGLRCSSAFNDAEAALAAIPPQKPDVILMDINLPRMSGIECVQRLRSVAPECQVLILTVYDDDDQIFKALKAGANGYLLKRSSPVELLQAISEVHRGGAPMSSSIARKVIQSFHESRPDGAAQLTAREDEVLRLLAQGYSYKEIAEKLSVSYETIHSHISSIYQKLHVRSRAKAISKYMRK